MLVRHQPMAKSAAFRRQKPNQVSNLPDALFLPSLGGVSGTGPHNPVT